MDHIIPLKRTEFDITNDWYRVHVLLSHRLGARVDDKGNARWTFAAHPDLDGAVIVRTQDPEAEAAAKAFAPTSFETHVPAAGQRISFAIQCSGRVSRPSSLQTIKERAEHKRGNAINSSKLPGQYAAHLDRVESLLSRSGLTGIEVEDLEDHTYFIRKTARQQERGIGIVGIRATGTATVSDIEALKATLAQGLGRDKAFGFGVLLTSVLDRKDIAA